MFIYPAFLNLPGLFAAAVATGADARAIEAPAHAACVDAINSNSVETLLADLTERVIYQSPGEPEIVGKAVVRAWATAYFDATRTHWNKSSIGFTVTGDWAFERYRDESTDTDRTTGAISHDTGKGVNVFRRGSDWRWRVAIDGWSSDKAAGS